MQKKIISTSEFDAAKADYDAEEARYREVNKRLVLFKKGPRKEKLIRQGRSAAD
ncbi:hypothetical protein [Candidatus Kuenenia stuttgartiensis]|uniref:hypothetical protein n=1 Tax=Kuenenia stuttgartiensis TaxID=174633 RepID=UPI00146BCABD|nr:hypothetical protein [Candidatus Kuenenia stuttgartiensis]